MYDALYLRQSVEKVDSISIESQLEYCKYETHGKEYKKYIDIGYSGKNTNRPAFEKMIDDIKQGFVSRVIVYKLDRISRSILDFTNMMDIFKRYNVEFISSTEKFDTSTPIGRAMLNICIVFAQLERETIQKRVYDSYYSRCKRGFYMGGRIPYGFKKTDTFIDNIKTSMYTPVYEEIEHIKIMFSIYNESNKSLGDIIKFFNENGINHLRNGVWNTSRISEILKNPIYVKADVDIYNFFKRNGASIVNPISDFTGYNACYLYNVKKLKGKNSLKDMEVVIAPHEGIISSDKWIKCRERFLQNRKSTQTYKTKNSWLIGKVKCGYCGYSLNVVKSNTKWKRYFVCSLALKSKKAKCKGTCSTIYVDILEEYIIDLIKKRLDKFEKLCNHSVIYENNDINRIKMLIASLDNEIEILLSNISKVGKTTIEYINYKIEQLDTQKKRLKEDIKLMIESERKDFICDYVKKFDMLTFDDKKYILDILIDVIKIYNDNIKIFWKI